VAIYGIEDIYKITLSNYACGITPKAIGTSGSTGRGGALERQTMVLSIRRNPWAYLKDRLCSSFY